MLIQQGVFAVSNVQGSPGFRTALIAAAISEVALRMRSLMANTTPPIGATGPS